MRRIVPTDPDATTLYATATCQSGGYAALPGPAISLLRVESAQGPVSDAAGALIQIARPKRAMRRIRASHSDDDLSSSVSLSLVLESHGNLTQLVAATDDGRETSGLDELLQHNQILPVVPHDEHAHLLAHER